MLEAHHYNTYGEDNGSTSSDTSQEDIEVPPPQGGTGPPTEEHTEATARNLPADELDSQEGSVQAALSVMKDHKTFLHKQQVLAKRYQGRAARLPRVVTSRGQHYQGRVARLPRVVTSRGQGVASADEGMRNSAQRGVSQVDKNRKRKLKKKRSKEKRQKTDQVLEDHSTS